MMLRKPLAATSQYSVAAAGRASTGDVAESELDFDRVYEEQFEFVWRALRLLGVAPEFLEDVTQDVFSVVARQLGAFEGRSSLRTWLFAILQRVAANQRRRQVRKLKPLEPLVDAFAAHGPSPQTQAENAEVVGLIERHCASLPQDQRALFVLALVEEVPCPELALAFGIPLNTVYSRIRSLRENLRRALAGGELEDDAG